MTGETVTAGHLGGFVRGGDSATFYPDLWTWLVRGPEKVRSVLDVGCGDGAALGFFASLGATGRGIDGVEQNDPRIYTHDFAAGPIEWDDFMPEMVDLVWCCEFVEHVDERCLLNFLPTFTLAPLVLLTHAFPGQQGHHHVNLREPSYWIGALAALGYQLDQSLTDLTRTLAAGTLDPHNHYLRSGLAFRNAILKERSWPCTTSS